MEPAQHIFFRNYDTYFSAVEMFVEHINRYAKYVDIFFVRIGGDRVDHANWLPIQRSESIKALEQPRCADPGHRQRAPEIPRQERLGL